MKRIKRLQADHWACDIIHGLALAGIGRWAVCSALSSKYGIHLRPHQLSYVGKREGFSFRDYSRGETKEAEDMIQKVLKESRRH